MITTIGGSKFDLEGAVYSIVDGGSIEGAVESLHKSMKEMGFIPLFSNIGDAEGKTATALDIMFFSIMAGIRFGGLPGVSTESPLRVFYYFNAERLGCVLTDGKLMMTLYQVESTNYVATDAN